MLKVKRSIIVFTTDYPFGKGEPFLETEINYLSEGFDKVILIASNTVEKQTRILPLNCRAKIIDLQVSRFQKSLSILQVLDFRFWKELCIIRKTYKTPLSKGIIATMLISLYRAKRVRKKVRSIVQNENQDNQLYFYSYWCDDVALGLAIAQKEFPLIKTFCRIHRWDVYFEESKVNYLPFRHYIFEHIKKIFSISQDGINYALESWKVSQRDKIILSRLGVNNNLLFVPSHNETLLLVSCSNVIEVKRVHLIAEALHQILDIKLKWVHIGDGPDRTKLELLIVDLPKNIEVELKGRIPNKKIYSYYAEIRPDLFINVSSSEGVPVSIMEAMSFGIPVIATNVGGNSEIVNEKNGNILPANVTIDELVDSIRAHVQLTKQLKEQKQKSSFDTWNQDYNASKNYSVFIDEIKSDLF